MTLPAQVFLAQLAQRSALLNDSFQASCLFLVPYNGYIVYLNHDHANASVDYSSSY